MTRQIETQFKVRLPSELDDWIEREAKRNRRTKTAEVAYRLQEAREVSERMAARQASQA